MGTGQGNGKVNGQDRTSAALADVNRITAAIQRGINRALRQHKLDGRPIVVAGADGKPVWIKPEDIEVPGDPAARGSAAPG
jgi:hypothetical protein